jgi:hypothetical protein
MTIYTIGKENSAKTLVSICINTARDLFTGVPSAGGQVLGMQLQQKIRQ